MNVSGITSKKPARRYMSSHSMLLITGTTTCCSFAANGPPFSWKEKSLKPSVITCWITSDRGTTSIRFKLCQVNEISFFHLTEMKRPVTNSEERAKNGSDKLSPNTKGATETEKTVPNFFHHCDSRLVKPKIQVFIVNHLTLSWYGWWLNW